MERHCKNALDIAFFLESHSSIEKVIYPGLESHPQHNIAKKQMNGFGGMISVVIKGGLQSATNFLEKTKLTPKSRFGLSWFLPSIKRYKSSFGCYRKCL